MKVVNNVLSVTRKVVLISQRPLQESWGNPWACGPHFENHFDLDRKIQRRFGAWKMTLMPESQDLGVNLALSVWNQEVLGRSLTSGSQVLSTSKVVAACCLPELGREGSQVPTCEPLIKGNTQSRREEPAVVGSETKL